MAYQAYRGTTLGLALQSSLDELVTNGAITAELASKILSQFDSSMTFALENRVKTRLNFTGKLENFRLCDSVWTLLMKDVEFRDFDKTFSVDKLKVVACDGTRTGVQQTKKYSPQSNQSESKNQNPKDKRRRR